MAVINNLKARFTGFYVNSLASRLVNCVGTYGTAEILNGGELEENTLQYDFVVLGLQDHTIKSIVVKSLLLTSEGNLQTTKNLTLGIDSYGSIFRGNFETSDSVKTIVSTEFSQIELQELNEKTISIVVAMNSAGSCYYGLHSIIINLQDIDYSIVISFTGPNNNRTTSTITPAILLVKQGAVDVTFSKDPSTTFDPNVDNIEGRMYFKKDGIFVDNYLYGVNAPATIVKMGLVKLQDIFETDPLTNEIIPPSESGIAASPSLVYGVLVEATRIADTEEYGQVKLQNTFDIDPNDGGIIIPLDSGIAASPLLVYNALATAKNYTDEQTNFSDDFEREQDSKLYIKWIEITS